MEASRCIDPFLQDVTVNVAAVVIVPAGRNIANTMQRDLNHQQRAIDDIFVAYEIDAGVRRNEFVPEFVCFRAMANARSARTTILFPCLVAAGSAFI